MSTKKLLDQKVTIFPNPATEKFTVSSPGKMIVGLDIFSTLGQHEYSLKNLLAYQVEVVASSLLPGPHFIKVRLSDGVVGQLILVN